MTVRQPVCQTNSKHFHLYGCETANDYENSSIGNLGSKKASITDSWKLKVYVVCPTVRTQIFELMILKYFCVNQLKGTGLLFQSFSKLELKIWK